MKKQTSIRHAGIVVLSSIVSLLILATAYAFLLRHDIAQEKQHYRYIAENEVQHIVTTAKMGNAFHREAYFPNTGTDKQS